MLGTIGSGNRIETSVVSDAVNVASRIEKLTKKYSSKILISKEVRDQLNANLQSKSRLIGNLRIRGKDERTSIWEVFVDHDENTTKRAINDTYELALKHYTHRQYEAALQLFQSCLEKSQDDPILLIYIKKCKEKLK